MASIYFPIKRTSYVSAFVSMCISRELLMKNSFMRAMQGDLWIFTSKAKISVISNFHSIVFPLLHPISISYGIRYFIYLSIIYLLFP